MDIPDYKPNTKQYRQEQREASAAELERRTDKVVRGVGKTKKKSEVRKFVDTFIADDARNVKSFVMSDIIIPAIKDAILGTVEMLLGYGKRGKKRRSTMDTINYTSYSDPARRYNSRAEEPRLRGGNFEDVIVDTKGEAEDVLAQLDAVIDRYKVARVTDLYDMVGLTAPYTGNRYGWTDITSAESIRLRDGSYLIKMPRAMPID